jgi:ferric-dicitrate binding protein FerR (iron transport regulator)
MMRSRRRRVWTSALLLALGLAAAGRGEATHSGADAPPLVVAQLPAIGNVEHTTGTLVIRRADGRIDQLRAKGSAPLFPGDECRTERASKAFVKMVDGTQVAMNEETTFRYQAREERVRGKTRIFKLLIGELWLRTLGPAQVEIETPVATAAIKGTELNIKVNPDGTSVLTVLEGLVEFGTPFGTCPIPKGTQSTGERGKRCTKPAPVDAAAAAAWTTGLVPR